MHSGFKHEHAKTAKDVLEAVKLVMKRFPATGLAVVGHSLGGALALLDSVYLAIHLPSHMKIRMIGYGMPRVRNLPYTIGLRGLTAYMRCLSGGKQGLRRICR